MDCRMPLAKEEKTSGKANNLLLSFFLGGQKLHIVLRFEVFIPILSSTSFSTFRACLSFFFP
jgi:hypothetical protein